jgi:glycosyltransferase involved in cell wall biosynthesis
MKVIISPGAKIYPFHTGYGGVEKYIYLLSKSLVKEGIDVEIVSTSANNKRESKIFENIKYTFVPPLITRRMPSPLRSYLFNLNLAKYLKKKDIDILHSYGCSAYTYLHFKKRVPTIIQLFLELYTDPYGIDSIKRGRIEKRIIDTLVKHLFKYCMIHADKIISQGDFQTEQIIKIFGVDRGKIFSLPIAVDISLIKEKKEEKEISRKDLGLFNDDFVLISVNRFTPNKGINYLVDAFNIIRQNLNNAKLILIGTGIEEGEIINKIRNYKLTDSIIHLKDVSENLLYNCYDLSDIFVSPTLQDDFIMGIQEAMVCGLPIVSTGQDFLVKDGVNGYVVPKRDPQAIADAVLKIYDNDELKKMGDMSQEMVKKCDMGIIAKIAIKEYEKLIEKY